jgi:hypothetical protein
MRNLITGFALLMITISFGQTESLKGSAKNSEEKIKIENLGITVTVDSAEELETTFVTEDIKLLLEELDKGEKVSFKIICNGEQAANGIKPTLTYEVGGNSNDTDILLKLIKKMKKAATKYYESKQ